MKYYFAPLEGITDLCYRNTHRKYFSGVDRYYMPFISPTQNHCLTKKEQRELPPAESLPCDAIPQILTKSADDFLWAAQCCKNQGYTEVNLNMGCPSGTVFTKGKGSGMLTNLDYLAIFLDEIFSKSPVNISVKTRVGVEDPKEFSNILNILNQYPITELTIHPRVRRAFYKGNIEMDAFRHAVEQSKHPLCYNGDVTSLKDISYILNTFPTVSAIMIGRGLVADPAMLAESTNRDTLQAFHEELFDEYCRIFGNKQNAMCRMKEIWSMMIRHFGDSHQYEKKLKRTGDYQTFRSLCREVFTNLSLVPIESSLLPYGESEL